MHIKFSKNGVQKEVKVGVSFTTFFFCPWVLLLRGLWVHALITFATFGMAVFYYMFASNKLYARKLAADGWIVSQEDKSYAFAKWNIKQ